MDLLRYAISTSLNGYSGRTDGETSREAEQLDLVDAGEVADFPAQRFGDSAIDAPVGSGMVAPLSHITRSVAPPAEFSRPSSSLELPREMPVYS